MNFGGKQGLNLEFGGIRVQFKPITELIVLVPGGYNFNGHWRGNLVGPRGLVWQIACVDQMKALGSSPMLIGAAVRRSEFEFSFTVPEVGCKAQVVSLVLDARSTSETLVQGSVWFHDLDIVRNGS